MNEKCNKWNPKENLIEKYYINSVKDDDNGLTIKLFNRNNNKNLIIKWYGIIDSYMYSKEGSNRELYNSLDSKKWTFFKMTDSKYVKWIKEQSCGIYDDREYIHFIIIGSNAVLDILVRGGRDPIMYEE
jgi:hypothetical protein